MCAVYLAHGVFSWRDTAARHEEQQQRGPKRAAPLNKAELASSIASRAALLGKSKVKVTPQALAEASLLMPTSTDQQGEYTLRQSTAAACSSSIGISSSSWLMAYSPPCSLQPASNTPQTCIELWAATNSHGTL